MIGHEARVDAFAAAHKPGFGQLLHDLRAPRGGIAKGQDRRAAACGKRTGEGRMIEMGVGHDDMGDLLTRGEGGQNRFQMRGRPRARGQ